MQGHRYSKARLNTVTTNNTYVSQVKINLQYMLSLMVLDQKKDLNMHWHSKYEANVSAWTSRCHFSNGANPVFFPNINQYAQVVSLNLEICKGVQVPPKPILLSCFMSLAFLFSVHTYTYTLLLSCSHLYATVFVSGASIPSHKHFVKYYTSRSSLSDALT